MILIINTSTELHNSRLFAIALLRSTCKNRFEEAGSSPRSGTYKIDCGTILWLEWYGDKVLSKIAVDLLRKFLV